MPPRRALRKEARTRIGVRSSDERGGPGWWIAHGGWAHPAGVCETLLAIGAGRIVRHFDREAASIDHRAGTWRIADGEAAVIASAPTLIVAAGHGMKRWPALGLPALIPVRGQVTHVPPRIGRMLDVVVCGNGYVAPLADGGLCVGATFQPGDADETLREADHAENLARLERMLPGFAAGLVPAPLDGRAAVRTATADRLPVCGPLHPGPDADGLLVVTGLGARGLIFAPLCAEVLAAALEQEPIPLERRLVRAIAPSRLAARAPGGSLF